MRLGGLCFLYGASSMGGAITSEERQWTPEQEAFQAWLGLPRELRDPKTQSEIAEMLGVTEWTLSRWKGLPGWPERVNLASVAVLSESVGDVLAALTREARKGSAKHIEIFLKLAKVYEDRQRIDLYAEWELRTLDYRTGLAALAPGSISDSDPSG